MTWHATALQTSYLSAPGSGSLGEREDEGGFPSSTTSWFFLAAVDMPTLGQPLVFLQYKDGLIADDGSITNEATAKFLQGWMDRYAAWVRRLID